MIAEALEGAHFPVIEAVDGDDALARLDTVTPRAVLLDLMMPGRTGFEVLEAMRADDRWREIPC